MPFFSTNLSLGDYNITQFPKIMSVDEKLQKKNLKFESFDDNTKN